MVIDSAKTQPAKLHHWEIYGPNLLLEYRQCLDEGLAVADLEPLVRSAAALPVGVFQEELADLIGRELTQRPVRPDYTYVEPSDLPAIRAARPAERPALPRLMPDTDWRDRIAGAWYGRICGCLLGKPVEGWRTPQLRRLLEATGNYPLQRYISRNDALLQELGANADRCWIENVNGCAPADDDTNYTVLAALRLVGRFGRDFTPAQVMSAWLDSQPKTAYCTAERVAFRNFVAGILPPDSAAYKNPFREWIGAQIRGDYFGYINPGQPELAAAMAWRDASISHVKNGIYGEMFVAAMLAAAAVCSDIPTVIQAGLAEVPEKSRLTAEINQVVAWYGSGLSADDSMARIHARYDEFQAHDWCHTNSNAMIVAAALLYGGLDFSRSICLAVGTGFDTDCNGATVGSIVGLMIGARAIPAVWTAPLGGCLDTSIVGVGKVRIDDLVDTTLTHLPK
jgi:ADP-ribosylglycohydrolase